MSVVSGGFTILNTGQFVLDITIPFTELEFHSGARIFWREPVAFYAYGHADQGTQFCHVLGGNRSETFRDRAFVNYNLNGDVANSFKVVGGWGTRYLTLDVSKFDPNFPAELVARS